MNKKKKEEEEIVAPICEEEESINDYRLIMAADDDVETDEFVRQFQSKLASDNLHAREPSLRLKPNLS